LQTTDSAQINRNFTGADSGAIGIRLATVNGVIIA
jgi:hypothetical protein